MIKKTFILLLCFLLLFSVTGCGGALKSAAELQEYDVGGDTVPSVNSIVGAREVSGVSSSAATGSVEKSYTYKSSTVTEDLTAYVTELFYERNYIVTEDIDLERIPGTAKLATESVVDSSRIVMVVIEYTSSDYKVTVTQMVGTLTRS